MDSKAPYYIAAWLNVKDWALQKYSYLHFKSFLQFLLSIFNVFLFLEAVAVAAQK